MKHGWLTCLALAGVAMLVGGCDMDFSKVDNPEYAAWKGFPVGSGYEFEGMLQTSAENPKRIQISANLMVFDLTQAVLKRRAQIFNPGGSGQLEFTDVIIPARVKKNDCLLTQDGMQDNFRGWDSVLVGEKLYDCEVHYYVVKRDGEILGIKTHGETGIKIWQCKKIPGGMAKIEVTGLSPSCIFSLSGQIVNVGMARITISPPGQATETETHPAKPANNPAGTDLEKAITSPEHLPIMPQPEKKVETSGLNTSSATTEEDDSAPKVILPATNPSDKKAFEEVPQKIEPVEKPVQRQPDPQLLSEVQEEDSPTSEPSSIKPVKLDVPERLDEDTAPLPKFAAPDDSK
ncbi:MAG TPA: hypothetical protein PKK48_03035 [Phycisphaerae bacterium]|nr:hypothetical protein [Phycisphaerae bacterium]HPS52465.1 hypothetical protein [Phycisphaerae bacterium]